MTWTDILTLAAIAALTIGPGGALMLWAGIMMWRDMRAIRRAEFERGRE